MRVLFCRCLSLRIHFDLHQCRQASCTDISEQRAQRRAWQQSLNHQIQRVALELLVNIFRSHVSSSPTSSSVRMTVSALGLRTKWCFVNRDVGSHLNYEHRVFNSQEFLTTREPPEQLFYRKVGRTCCLQGRSFC